MKKQIIVISVIVLIAVVAVASFYAIKNTGKTSLEVALDTIKSDITSQPDYLSEEIDTSGLDFNDPQKGTSLAPAQQSTHTAPVTPPTTTVDTAILNEAQQSLNNIGADFNQPDYISEDIDVSGLDFNG